MITLIQQNMNTDQLMNGHTTLLEEEGKRMHLNDLLERINAPNEEVRLSRVDKLKITYGLRLLELELSADAGISPD